VVGPGVDAAQSPRDHLAVVIGDVGEAAEPRDVTCSKDAGPRLERRRVHLQPAALRLCEAGGAPGLGVGTAACGHQQPICTHQRSGLQMDDDGGAFARGPHELRFDGETGIPDDQHHAVRLQVRPERGSRLGFLQAEERRSGFDHGDSAAKACEGLPEFDPDRAAAEDGDGDGQLPRNRGLAIGPELDGVEAGNRWNDRRAAVGDHHGTARDELLGSHRDSARVCQGPFAAKQSRPARCHRGGWPAVVEAACHPPRAFGDFGKVDGPFHA